MDLCLGHFGPPGGDPAHPAEEIRHQQCLPEDRTEWLIKRLPPVGARECPDRLNVGIKNHDTKLYVNHGDRNRPLMGNEEKLISLVPAGQSAHGCTVQVIGPPESCMAAPVPAEGSADSEVAWMPCNKGRSDQRWLIEFSNKSDGRNWLLFHPIDDTSRCLRQSENDVKTAPLCQGGWLAQWTVE